jgi:hypothetical protein
MHVPLYTLETGVVDLARTGAPDDAQLRLLERAVTRLREFASSMPDLSALRG